MTTVFSGFIKNGLEYFLCYVMVAYILCYLKYDNKIVDGQPRIAPSRETIRMTSILAFWGFFLLFLIAVLIVG
jgi:hypothetical protein